MECLDLQKYIAQCIDQNNCLHLPVIPGYGLSVVPVIWAKATKWDGTIIYVIPKAIHTQMAHEIMKMTGHKAKFLVGMTQEMPLFPRVLIVTPQTLRFRVDELCHVGPRFVVAYNIKTRWDDVRKLCKEAERVCLLGGESTINTRRILG